MRLRHELVEIGKRMRALHRGDDALDLREALEGIECLLVRDRDVLDNPFIFIIGMLWSDARVVEAGRDGVRLDDLAVRVLQQVAEGTVQDARLTGTGERLGIVRRRLAAPPASTPNFLTEGSLRKS